MGKHHHLRRQAARRALFGPVVLGLAVGWAGCGGTDGPNGNVAVDESGNEIVSAGGAVVTREAHNHWVAAIRMFEAHEEEARTRAEGQGWTEQNCEQTAHKFEEANNAQGGDFVEAIYMMGVVQGRCGDDEAALGHYRRALEVNGEYCGARVGVALADMRAGRFPEARQLFEQAVRDDNQCTAAYVNLAIIQSRDNADSTEALNNLRRALAIESDYLPAFNQMALLYYHQAQGGHRQMLDLAEVVCRQAQLINQNYAPIYNTWGLINVRQGNIIAALAKFQRAFQLDDDFYEAFMNFGQLTLSYRGYEDAAMAFGRARRLRPRSYDAVIGLGAAQRGLNRLDEAEQTYRAAMELQPQRPEAYFNMGLLYQDYKGGAPAELRQAKTFFEQFTQRAGNQARFADAVENVTRRCRRRRQRRRRGRRARQGESEWVGECRPGRLQQIDLAIQINEEMAQIQAEFGGGGDGGGDGGDGGGDGGDGGGGGE